jgi:hypothetical protein
MIKAVIAGELVAKPEFRDEKPGSSIITMLG